MELTAIQSLMTTTLSDFGDEVLIVLTAVIGVAIAYFLFKFAWRAIKRSVGGGTPTGSPYKGHNNHGFGYKINERYYHRDGRGNMNNQIGL